MVLMFVHDIVVGYTHTSDNVGGLLFAVAVWLSWSMVSTKLIFNHESRVTKANL